MIDLQVNLWWALDLIVERIDDALNFVNAPSILFYNSIGKKYLRLSGKQI